MSSFPVRTTKYSLLADLFRQQIASGALREGDRLPSFAEMRAHHGASPLTVDRALATLEREGLIVRVNGSGTFVAAQRSVNEVAESDRPLIGLILPNCDSVFFSSIISGVEEASRAAGYNLLIANSQGNHELEAQLLSQIARQTVGLCVMACGWGNQSAFAPLLEARVPFVLLDREVPGIAVPLVTSDNESGGYDATRHLLATGHVPFVVGESLETSSSLRDRVAGFRRALREAGLPFDPTRVALGENFSSPEVIGYEKTRQILGSQGENGPVAIFALNDLVARGVYLAVREKGLRIPADVAVVGFDDVVAADFHPPLSSVHQNLSGLGIESVKRLLEAIKTGASTKASVTRLSPHLVVRNSSDESSDFCRVTQLLSASSSKVSRNRNASLVLAA